MKTSREMLTISSHVYLMTRQNQTLLSLTIKCAICRDMINVNKFVSSNDRTSGTYAIKYDTYLLTVQYLNNDPYKYLNYFKIINTHPL